MTDPADPERASATSRPVDLEGAPTFTFMFDAKWDRGQEVLNAAVPPPGPGSDAEVDDVAWFCRITADYLRYVGEWNKWVEWDGRRWEPGPRRIALKYAQLMPVLYRNHLEAERLQAWRGEALTAEGAAPTKGEMDKAATRRIRDLGSIARTERIVRGAEGRPDLQTSPAMFDRDLYSLNCPNGVVSLADGTLVPHSPELYLTTLCPTPYDPEAEAPRWEAFVLEVMRGDEALADYLQRIVGYAATGVVQEREFFVLLGEQASNGKSTFMGTIAKVLGPDYVRETPLETFGKKSGTNPELAAVMGARIVQVDETEENTPLAAAKPKAVTGGEGRQQVRLLYQNPVTVPNRMKLMIATNRFPRFNDSSPAIRDRVRVVPFRARFEKRSGAADLELRQRLEAEAAGILHWIVRGALRWREEGLRPPEGVDQATDEAVRQSDPFARFVGERCEKAEGARTDLEDIYQAYVDWCRGEGEKEMPRNQFGNRFREMGYIVNRSSPETGGNRVQGLRLSG